MTPEYLRHVAATIRDPRLLHDLSGVVLTDAAHKNDPRAWHHLEGRVSHHDERTGNPDDFDLADELDDRANVLERVNVDEDHDDEQLAAFDALRAGAI